MEALTQSVELLTGLHRDLEQSTARNFDKLIGAMERLANIASTHEERIERLEGK
jgi:hypothetical protein